MQLLKLPVQQGWRQEGLKYVPWQWRFEQQPECSNGTSFQGPSQLPYDANAKPLSQNVSLEDLNLHSPVARSNTGASMENEQRQTKAIRWFQKPTPASWWVVPVGGQIDPLSTKKLAYFGSQTMKVQDREGSP